MNSVEFAQIAKKMVAHWHVRTPETESLALYGHELGEFPAETVMAAVDALIREGRPHFPVAGEIRRKIVELELDILPWVMVVPQLRAGLRHLDEWEAPHECLDDNPDCDGTGTLVTEGFYPVKRRRWCECSKTEVTRRRKRALRAQGRLDKERCAKGVCDGSGLVEYAEQVPHQVATDCTCRPKLVDEATPRMHPVVRYFARLVTWPVVRDWLLSSNSATAEAQMRTKYEALCASAIESRSLAGLKVALPRVDRANRELEHQPGALGHEVRKQLAAASSAG